jgi:hypothetical protein
MQPRRKTYPARELDNTLEWQRRRLAGIRAHKPGYADKTLSCHRQLFKDLIGGLLLAAICIIIAILALAF